MVTQAILPPPTSGDFWPGTCEFSGFGDKIRRRKLGGSHQTFPKARQFLKNSYDYDFFKKLFKQDRCLKFTSLQSQHLL
jgi:hypothetical protein